MRDYSKNEGGFVLAVLSASQRLNLRAFRILTGMKRLRLATKKDLRQLNINDYDSPLQLSALPPFGSMYGIPCWVDRSLN